MPDHRFGASIRFEGQLAGLFLSEACPETPGDYSYMPVRSLAHYKLGVAVRSGQPAQCTWTTKSRSAWLPEWQAAYDSLMVDIAAALDGVPDLDLTAELITHRFTPKSKGVLEGWYPGSKLEMDEALRTRKLTKFGSTKWVFPKEQMAELRGVMEASLTRHLPAARVL